MVGRRGEAPLVPPYILTSFKKALALVFQCWPLDVVVEVPVD